MPQKYLAVLKDWSLGVNNRDFENLINDRELASCNNAVLGRGFVAKRNGYGRYTPTALVNPIHQIYEYVRNTGATEFLAVSNKSLHKDTAGVLSAIPFSGITELTTNTTDMITYKDRNINDVTLIADGGKLKRYNGANVAEVVPHTPTTAEQTNPGLNDLANLTNFRALAVKKDRIFALAHPTIKNRLSFCYHDPVLGYATLDYFPAPFFIDIAAAENDEMVQLEVFRDQLIILGKRTLFSLIGDGGTIGDYQLHKINVPTGCIAPRSVSIVGNYLFYLSDDNVYKLFATEENYVSAEIVSSKLEKTLKGISRANKEKAVGLHFDDKYYLSFPDGTTLLYDSILDAWTTWTNVKANSFVNRSGVLHFSANTGLIYKFEDNRYNDDGSVIKFSMTTKNMNFEYDVQDKKFKKVWMLAKQYGPESSSFNLTGKIDYINVSIMDATTDESGTWGEAIWGKSYWGFVDVVQRELRIREKGKSMQLTISNEKIDEPVTIYGIVLMYKVKKP